MYFKINKPVKGHTSSWFKGGFSVFFLFVWSLPILLKGHMTLGFATTLLVITGVWLYFIIWVPLWQKFSFRPVLALNFQPTSATVIFKNQPPQILDYEAISGDLVLCVNSTRTKHGYDAFISQMKFRFCILDTENMFEVVHQPSRSLFEMQSIAGSNDLLKVLPYWESLAKKTYQVELTHPKRNAERMTKRELLSGIQGLIHAKGKVKSILGSISIGLGIGLVILGIVGIWKFPSLLVWMIFGGTYCAIAVVFLLGAWCQDKLARDIEADFIRQDAIVRER